MAKPYALVNECQNTLATAYVRGTDNHVHLTSAADFPTGGGYIRIGDDTSFCLCEYTAVSTNDLTGVVACTLGVVVSVGDETKEWPIGTVVSRVWMAEEAAELITGPASATDGHFYKADGTTGKKAKAEAIAVADLGSFVTQAATTLYVAKTGNDGNAGTAGSPKLTIGGALDSLPVVLAHACTINVSPGEYDEILTTKLSRFIIPASLTIEAKDTADRVWHVRGSATAGAATTIDVEAAHVLVDDEWNNAYITIWQDTGAGQIRAITDSDESDNRLTVATWDTNPASGSDYILWGAVRIDGETTSPVNCSGLRNVTFKGIGFKVSGAASTSFVAQLMSSVVLEDCGSIDETYGIQIKDSSTAQLSYCSCLIPASGYGFMVNGASYASCVAGVAYGAKSSDVGFYATNGSILGLSTSYPNQARHVGTGVYALNNGMVIGSTGMVYTDNTVNTNPDTPASTADLVADGMSFIQDQA